MNVSDKRFTLRGSPGGTWLAVQRIRLAGSMSAPILARLGFEKTCQLRRLQDDHRTP